MYIISFLVILAVHYFVRIGLFHWLITNEKFPLFPGEDELFSFNHVVAITLGEIYVIGLVSAIKFTSDYVIELNKNNLLFELQIETEMKYLKAQMQPHFFFNTLNNLYALTLLKSEKAPDVVLKLSEIMEYVLYDVNSKKISLIKEINYVHNYIELEKIRKGDLVECIIEIIGKIDDVSIPPFLFLPFVENCFKHGQLNTGRIIIDMYFKRIDEKLEFRLENSYQPEPTYNEKSGIGLINIKRRLELLFGDSYQLENYSTEDKYIVVLNIPI